MSWLKRTIMAGGGKRNWFGDESDGDIRITSAGAEQSFDGGVTWATISAWLLVGAVVSIPSVQDGDMVLVNARSLTVDTGYTLTTANRCRGLLVYGTGALVVDGEISMSARGCHANPADAAVTSDTPVAPSDGHAVPEDGITLRRLADGYTDTDARTDLMHGCGSAAVTSEANQPEVKGNGVALRIPRVGGPGGEATINANYNQISPGGGTAEDGSGGGGAGGSSAGCQSGAGAAGTCFGGGPGGGGATRSHGEYPMQYGDDATPYGGPGGDGALWESDVATSGASGGSGNPGGLGATAGVPGLDGIGGLLILVFRGDVSGAGVITVAGIIGGTRGGNQDASGGSTGGGILVLWYGGAYLFTGTLDVAGGPDALSTAVYPAHGGPGGEGSLNLCKIDQ